MKRFLLVSLTGLIGFMGACTGGLFLWVAVTTGDSAVAAESFLSLIEDGRTHDAYLATASPFREAQDEATFVKFMQRLDIRNYSLEPWRDRMLERWDQAFFRGTLDQRPWYDDPRTLPFRLDMLKEAGEWKVVSFTGRGRVLVGAGAWFSQIPNDEDLGEMSRDTFLAFDRAVKAGDFAEFYENMSLAFKIGVPLFQLQAAYQRFIDNEIDVSGVADLEPVFDKLPSINRSRDLGDVLVVSGYFPTAPSPIPFVLRYRYEHPRWALYKFLVKFPDPRSLSPDQCIQWLLSQGDKNTSQRRSATGYADICSDKE